MKKKFFFFCIATSIWCFCFVRMPNASSSWMVVNLFWQRRWLPFFPSHLSLPLGGGGGGGGEGGKGGGKGEGGGEGGGREGEG